MVKEKTEFVLTCSLHYDTPKYSDLIDKYGMSLKLYGVAMKDTGFRLKAKRTWVRKFL